MNIVSAEKVTKDYRLGMTVVNALKDIDLTVESGEFMAIAGPSGSGKSTLLNLIGCIEKPTSGIIKIDGIDVLNHSSNELAEIRANRIGFIFQTFNLLPVLTVAENVEYPLHLKRDGRDKKSEKSASILKEVGLEKFARHKPAELSGGQRQRVAIARALVCSPSIILADEPTANLDHNTGTDILHLMKELNKKFGTTFIFSTHDQKIMAMADRIVELRDGRKVGDSCII